jgi:hypothetical protein
MAVICSLECFSFSGFLLLSSCMTFSHREMKSRSDSSFLGFGTGIKNHQKTLYRDLDMFSFTAARMRVLKASSSIFSSLWISMARLTVPGWLNR